MGRREEPVEPGPLFEFATDLRALRTAAGSPPYRALERTARFAASTLADAASGTRLPTREVTLAYVTACGGDAGAWGERWSQLAASLRATNPGLIVPQDAPIVDAPGPPRADSPAVQHDPAPSLPAGGPGQSPITGEALQPLVEPLDRDDPRRVGPFHLVGRLGAGGMGQVYLGASPAGRSVAVKLIRPELARDPSFRRRFARESAAARTVTGGHTPAVIDADPGGDLPWLATAFVPGPSLAAVTAAGGPLPEPVVLALAAGVAEALAAIHAAGIVHRDLKPSNILLDHDGPKVIDFGISRALDASALTSTGMVVGTVGYTAPELAARGEVGPPADVFSLGVVLAYAATGIAPFGVGRSSEVLYRVVHEPPDPRALACQDNNLRRLIGQCLDKDPAARPTPGQIIEIAAHGGEHALPAALAAQIARRSQDAAQLLAGAQRARTTRRVSIGLAPLLLILAIATVAALIPHNTPTHLDTAPPENTASAAVASLPTVAITPTSEPSSAPPSPSSPAAAAQLPSTVPTTQSSTGVVETSATSFAAHATQVTSPDFNGYCAALGDGSAKLTGGTAYGWRCSGADSTTIDLDAACRWTNSTNQAHASIASFYTGAVDCWDVTRDLGAADFNGYCQSLGYPGATYNSGQYAYGWGCENDPGFIRADTTCQWTYGSAAITAVISHFYEKDAWQCWG